MDADVARWIMEFLLRSSLPDSTAKKIFKVLPFSRIDPRLMKTLLLRSIQSDVSKALFTETLLDTLEIIEELDKVDGITITETMKQAYCAVAVECTIRYLEASADNNNQGLYFDAVKRIWRGRVRQMEAAAALGKGSDLWTAELNQWRDDIEAALWDSKVCERLAKTNAREIALDKVRAYLTEIWEFMGSSFLELAAILSELKVSSYLCGDNKGDTRGEVATDRPGEGRDIGVCESVLASDPMNVCDARLQNSSNIREGLVASDRIELDNAAICTEKATVAGGNQDSEQGEKRAMSSVDGNRELDATDSPPETERASENGKLPLKHKHTASSTWQRKAKIMDAEKVGPTTMSSKYDPLSSIEVKKLRESLKSSSLELQAVVKDPLPDILHKSDIVRSELAMKGISHEPPLENQSRDVDVPKPNSCRSIVLYEPIDAIIKKNSSVNWSNVHRPKLMERNSTAHTYEWDDSINKSPEGMPRKRRIGKRWTSLEEETLVAGVKKFGKGNWKTILNFYSEIFKKTERTEVDLKDKWRNMTR